jgi:hypothetical protein
VPSAVKTSEDNQVLQLDEVRDVHPIFRANPFLIEEGLKLVRGEKYFAREELKHIDLQFEDKARVATFVEVKWSDVSEVQMAEYERLVRVHFPGSRLLWAVPTDLANKVTAAPKYGIEVKLFDRDRIIGIRRLQNEADRYLQEIKSLLSNSFKITMHGEPISFENPVVACYFEGHATTDKGSRKKLGLKQQSVGRQLDLLKNLAMGHVTELHKEKIMLLMWEVFVAPYSYKSGKFWRIMHGGFIELIKERQDRPLEKLVTKIWDVISEFYNRYAIEVKEIYDNQPSKYDLLLMFLLLLSEGRGKVVFSVDELIKFFIDEFEIRPSMPPHRLKHSILNQWVENVVSVKGYKNDMAKRLLEVATLKRMLMPRMGTVEMWILTPSKRNGEIGAQRQPCQMLAFNKDAELYLRIEDYYGEEGENESM